MADDGRLESNNGALSLDGCLDLGSNHKLFGDWVRMKAAFAYGEYATCGQQHVCVNECEKEKGKNYFILSVVITEKVAQGVKETALIIWVTDARLFICQPWISPLVCAWL